MAHALSQKLVVISGVQSKPELNGQLGLANAFDEAKGRFEVLLMNASRTSVALRPINLVDWKESVVGFTANAGTADLIASATPAETLRFMREGCVTSTTGGVARACFDRLLKLPFRSTGRELTSGGQIEMMVQAMDAHMADRGEIFFLMFTISNTVVFGDDMSRSNLAAEMKDRAVRAGLYPRLAAVLSTHTTSDVQCVALSLFPAVATGGGFPETEARREAAGAYMAQIAAAMKLQAHRSAVQHFGIQAIVAIVAMNDRSDVAPAARADAAIAVGVHATIIEAMLRHGHTGCDDGKSSHSLETTAFGVDEQGQGNEIKIVLPGSVLLSGCQALQLLTDSSVGDKERRIDALIAAGALKAIATAVRTNPTFSGNQLTDVAPNDLKSMKILQPLIIQLCGERKLTEIMAPEDHATLIGSSEAPGFILGELIAHLKSSND